MTSHLGLKRSDVDMNNETFSSGSDLNDLWSYLSDMSSWAYDEVKAEYDNKVQTLGRQYEIAYDYMKSWQDEIFKISRMVIYLFHRPVDEEEFKSLGLVSNHLYEIMTILLNELARINLLKTNTIYDDEVEHATESYIPD